MSSVLDVPVQIALVMALAISPEVPERPPAVAPADKRAQLGFSDDSWIAALHRHGRAAGAAHLSDRIFRTTSGRHYIPATDDRRAILTAKTDPDLAARVAVALARANATNLAQRLGRQPSLAEVYMAHTFGLEATVSLLLAAAHDPAKPAAEIVPRLAFAEPRLFFEKGRLRTAQGVAVAIERAFAAASLRAAQGQVIAAKFAPRKFPPHAQAPVIATGTVQ